MGCASTDPHLRCRLFPAQRDSGRPFRQEPHDLRSAGNRQIADNRKRDCGRHHGGQEGAVRRREAYGAGGRGGPARESWSRPVLLQSTSTGSEGERGQEVAGRGLSMPRPDFNPSRYDQQRQDWTRQRNALRTYAHNMGTKVGKFNETVHDVLWRTIARKGSDAGLPPAVSAAQLRNVEEVAPAEVKAARNSIARLTDAENEFKPFFESGGQLPWRGVEKVDLSPIEVEESMQLLGKWERRLDDLEDALSANGLNADGMKIQEADFVHRGAEVVLRMPDVFGVLRFRFTQSTGYSRRYTPVGGPSASYPENRRRTERQVRDRRRQIAAIADVGDLRWLGSAAVSLGIVALSAREARSEAQSLREMAERRDYIDEVLERLASYFGFEAGTAVFSVTIEQGVDLLREADADVLSSRTDALTTYDSVRIIERAENECRELKQLRNELGERFDLASLPDREKLQQAARSLNGARRPLLFDRPARQAMRLYREMSLVRSKTSAEEGGRGDSRVDRVSGQVDAAGRE